MAGFETEIHTGVAELLEREGIGAWQPSGAYPATTARPPIFIRVAPDKPDALLMVGTYPVRPEVDPDDSILGLQIVTRTAGADPRPCDDLDGRIYDLLHGRANFSLGGHRVTKCLLQSGASLGQDAARRWSRSANYYLTMPR